MARASALRARLGGRLPLALRALLGRLNRLGNRRRSRRELWQRGLRPERDYWAAWIDRRGGRHRDKFECRMDPDSELRSPLREVIARLPGATVSVLDVGAGPMTTVGKVHPGKELQIVAIDPLARDYEAMLERAGIEPPVPTVHGEAENLVERFGRDCFDVAHADNALDHTAEPLAAIESMLDVVRPGGYVVLRHHANEGERNFYLGLHQWNLDVREGELIVWNPSTETNVSRHLEGRATVECDRRGHDVICVIAKPGRGA